MHKIILLRHGLSKWNLQNRFTGWQDVDLANQRIMEAKIAGQAIRDNGYKFDLVFTSFLKRAIRTMWIVMEETDRMWVPVVRDWRLNERHYGALTGLNKAETSKKYGEEQVLLWRRSYDITPPLLDRKDARFPGNDPKYSSVPEYRLPQAECLKDTGERVVECWQEQIAPQIISGKKVLIVAHGNSLRALVMQLDRMSKADILQLNIPTGIPLVYELDKDLNPIQHFYIGDKERVASVLSQGKA